jgi:uncharacterized protein YqeY
MTIKEQVEAEIRDAMKARDRDRLSALRMIKSEFLVKEKEGGESLSDAHAEETLRKMFNKYRKAKAEYDSLGKADEAEQYARDIEIIESFMSAPMMGEDEIKRGLQALIAELGAEGPKDFGTVMKAFMSANSNADGKAVSSLLKEMLNG